MNEKKTYKLTHPHSENGNASIELINVFMILSGANVGGESAELKVNTGSG